MRLFPLFLLWPLAEIALFVIIGGRIGLLATLAVIFGSGALGVWLLKSRGVRSTAELQRGFRLGAGGLGQIADGALTLFAAVLLILPGFLTDAIGILLLVPPVRRLVILWGATRFAGNITVGPAAGFDRGESHRQNVVIDGEFIEVEPDPNCPPSGWTRH